MQLGIPIGHTPLLCQGLPSQHDKHKESDIQQSWEELRPRA